MRGRVPGIELPALTYHFCLPRHPREKRGSILFWYESAWIAACAATTHFASSLTCRRACLTRRILPDVSPTCDVVAIILLPLAHYCCSDA